MITPASHPSVSLLLCLPQSTSIQLYKRYSVLNPGPSTVQHKLVCANSRPYSHSNPYLLYLLGKPIHYQSVTASTWISLSRTVLGILVQDTHPLTSLIALVVVTRWLWESNGRRWKEMEHWGRLWMAVESCRRIQNVGESYRIHWGFVENYGSLWNIGVHRIGNT